MTSEREAKIWMVVAGVMVVWACTMVGCTSTTVSGPATPLNRPAAIYHDPAWSSTPTLTLTADLAEPADIEAVTTPAPVDSTTLFLQPLPEADLSVSPRSMSPRFDAELSGLSIAQPLVSAKRLLVAAVTILPPMQTPEWAQATSAAAHADWSDQPIAATTGWVQRLAFESPSTEEPIVTHGLAVLGRSSVMLPPWDNGPIPTPTVAATLTADEAKFDSAGLVALVIGAMVLLFGGEAVVLWMLNRGQKSSALAHPEVVVEDAEQSIFRFPEPIEVEADDSYSQAA